MDENFGAAKLDLHESMSSVDVSKSLTIAKMDGGFRLYIQTCNNYPEIQNLD